jgi:hypothetical protein
MSQTATASPGKTSFVKEFLSDHPQGNVNAVNEAWRAAGYEGIISHALVTTTRAQLGLTGNIRRKPETTRAAAEEKAASTGRGRGRLAKATTATIDAQPRGRESGRSIALEGLEADIDDLPFKIMRVGDLPQVEEAHPQARRPVYGQLTRG